MWLRRTSALLKRHTTQTLKPRPNTKQHLSARQPRPQRHRSDPEQKSNAPIPNLQPATAMNYHTVGAVHVPPAGRTDPYSISPALHGYTQTQSHAQHSPPAIPGLSLLEAMAKGGPPPSYAPADLAKMSSFTPANAQPAPKGRKSKHAFRKAAAAAAAASNASSELSQKTSDNSTPRPSSTSQDGRDERVPPSSDSGGIPDPSPLYLAQAFALPSTLADPRRILVILDLNGTLLFRPTRKQPTQFVERPHARRFLAYCLDFFHLAVWSSARPENVQHMLAQLLTSEQRQRCVVIWGRDRFGLSQDDYNSRVQCYKRLSAMWNHPDVRASHPHASRGGRWDQSNTVLVDDSPEKGRSEPHNILPIPEFSGLKNEQADVLPQVHDYLNTLCYQADISRYMRQSPFTLDPYYKLHPPPSLEA
ncbi:putative FCP1y domain-containing protein [Tolypocladium ophioglossoides CBS 100239]|uniref:Mitochondrial import inner membrane translocase subunit TIM50 n=1 Tax=Tolypocladium ophioglossoides (strain CBS 100239) TaxID=1163406 RepID=A0A0L0NJD1_TOLOC|nr:putative FCP1y domain-containing protein [Tolypocladium ophioglossoides CBS 100239]